MLLLFIIHWGWTFASWIKLFGEKIMNILNSSTDIYQVPIMYQVWVLWRKVTRLKYCTGGLEKALRGGNISAKEQNGERLRKGTCLIIMHYNREFQFYTKSRKEDWWAWGWSLCLCVCNELLSFCLLYFCIWMQHNSQVDLIPLVL